jgi:hypothetical protein
VSHNAYSHEVRDEEREVLGNHFARTLTRLNANRVRVYFVKYSLCDNSGRAQTSAVLCEELGEPDENILLKALDFIFKGRLVEV